MVVVTGVPGSGKTTLGSALSAELNARFLSLDVIKEDLYARRRQAAGLDLRIAAEARLEESLAEADETVVLDMWVQPGRDTDRIAAMLDRQGTLVVEVLCRVPAAVAVRRYRDRHRAAPHLPPDDNMLARIRTSVDELTPLGVGTCIEIDTSEPVDAKDVLARL
jgi:predicted kinase